MTASAPQVESGVFGNYINGQWRAASSGKTTKNRNPANRDEVIAEFASSEAADVAAALDAASDAADARFVPRHRLCELSTTDGLAELVEAAANLLQGRALGPEFPSDPDRV